MTNQEIFEKKIIEAVIEDEKKKRDKNSEIVPWEDFIEICERKAQVRVK